MNIPILESSGNKERDIGRGGDRRVLYPGHFF